MDSCVISSLGLLQIAQLWIFLQSIDCIIDHMQAFLLGIYLAVELQDHSIPIINFGG